MVKSTRTKKDIFTQVEVLKAVRQRCLMCCGRNVVKATSCRVDSCSLLRYNKYLTKIVKPKEEEQNGNSKEGNKK